MILQLEVKLFPDKLNNSDYIKSLIFQQIKSHRPKDFTYIIRKRSIDARGKRPFYLLKVDVYIDETVSNSPDASLEYKVVRDAEKVLIIGAGPAGYFAALQCLSLGLKPVVLDRGKDVQARRRDLRAIQQFGEVNPDSNYCFGEGGAGTYSDGKLYTRSHKRGDIEKVLQQLVQHGANPDILIDAHPHIGSNKLPGIIANIRKTIENQGGEIHFDTRIDDLIIENGKIIGVRASDGTRWHADAVILATGHSARDVYQMLHAKGILIEPKPFALGLRIEHPQSFIDKVQYKQEIREENLPAASYSVVAQVRGKGVFSFCMCPGGLIVPAATAPGEIVVNGMSLSRRDSPFANSGFVTSIDLDELKAHGYSGIFAALDFQKEVEKAMFAAGDGTQKAPAQRVSDFVAGRTSESLNPSSYIPGLFSAPLHRILPEFVYQRLREGLIEINKKMPGFLSEEANIVGVESRTSAPIRIPRDKDSLMHPEVEGLFPCGEGAGYAGGILSAAMDGQNVAMKVKRYFESVSI
jgi:uncharacterized FAD-dependent dehydrogenase